MASVNGQAFKVETGLSMPAPRVDRIKYPFGTMKVGDSFAFPAELHPKITPAASYWGTRHAQKFSIRRDGDGYRCWRIE